MAEEQYEIANKKLYVVDPELGLNVQLPFDLASLPAQPSADQILPTGEKIVVKLDEQNRIEKIYLEIKGKWHGQCRLLYPSGKVQAEMFYHDNLLHGPSNFFNEQGVLLSSSWFCFGAPQGKVRQYYASGQVCSIQRYKDGQYEDRQDFFYEDGSVKTLMHYKQGVLNGEVKLFWPKGSLKREIYFVNGKRSGWDKLWNEHQILIDEGEYKDGNPIGYHLRRYENGSIREELVYHAPNRFNQREWDEKGRLVYEGLYSPDLSYVEKVWDAATNTMKERLGYWDGAKLCWK